MRRILLTQDNFKSTVLDAVEIIKNGGIIIAPFDTVYGFIANPFDEVAIDKLNKLKSRPETKTIGLAGDSIESIETAATITEENRLFIKNKTPGKFTFILEDNRQNEISDLCKRGNSIAVRIPDNELIINIARNFGGLVAQTSANKSGENNIYDVEEIMQQFDSDELDRVGLIIDGGTLPTSGPSEIWDLTRAEPVKIERK